MAGMRANCDLIASILNPNSSFSATLAHKSEITSKFLLVFNKFTETIACKRGALRDGDRANGGRRMSPEGVMEKRTQGHKRHGKASGGFADLAEFVQSLARTLFDPYRPELYYMRGPGPKWHAKHDRTAGGYPAIPALVRVRAKR